MSTNLQIPDERLPTTLALLVGSNPLPNYLAIAVLTPRKAVVLLHSPETQEPCVRLRAAITERWPALEVEPVCIADATDARKTRDACARLDVDHLHYSGGTKPMAVHARHALGVDDKHASYLDEPRGWVRFDDGYDVPLNDCQVGLSLDILLRLHGIDRKANTPPADDSPTDSDLEQIARHVRVDPELPDRLYKAFRVDGRPVSFTEAKASPRKPGEHGLALSVATIPEVDWNRKRFERWADFLGGVWLEHWTARLILSCLGGGPPEVGVKCKRAPPSGAEFEIDVALVRGHRLYVVSCTTETRKSLCKSKSFEVAMRARQMGGDLARSALVCLSDPDTSDALRKEIASLWDAPNVPRVFGLADLREWAGDAGAPNTGSLKEWLDT